MALDKTKALKDEAKPLLEDAVENGTRALHRIETQTDNVASQPWVRRLIYGAKVEAKSNNFWRIIIGEFYGTALLCYMVQTIVYTSVSNNKDPFVQLTSIAVLHVIFFCILYLIFQPITGCLVNPAVVLNFAIIGRLHWLKAILIILFEFVGCLFGSSLVLWGFAEERRTPKLLGVTAIPDHQTIQNALIGEIAGSFILNIAVLGHLDPETGVTTKLGAVTIGATIGFLVETVAPISAASLNPFRTLGPAITLHYYKDIWVYMVGPTIGAILAGLAYTNFLKDKRNIHKWYKYGATTQNDVVSYFQRGAFMPEGIAFTEALKVKKWITSLDGNTTIPVKDYQCSVLEFFQSESLVSQISVNFLNKLHRQYKPQNVYFIGVSCDGKTATENYVRKHGPEYSVGTDQDGSLNYEFLDHVTTDFLPITVVMKFGNVLWIGSSTNPDLPKAIEIALGRNPSSSRQNLIDNLI